MYSAREYWMGLSRDVTYDTVWGGWTWTDGSTLDWDNWDKSEPSNDYGCVYMEGKDGEWKEDKCDQNLYCMCEVKSKFTASYLISSLYCHPPSPYSPVIGFRHYCGYVPSAYSLPAPITFCCGPHAFDVSNCKPNDV